ncbi:hypothetical protein BH10ACT2_BH10ACT2_25340 [soil metagenome]
MSEPVVIRLPALAGGQAESWRALIEIAPHLGRHWLLIGGQMVLLHEVERESTDTRPTNDIDLVVDLRIDPAALEHTHSVLAGTGFSQDLPSPEGVAHRYRRDGATIDILAPDHMGTRAQLSLGSGRTIEAPGTSQAFGRVSLVRVELDDTTAAVIRRPTLVGALLGKATAVAEIVSMSSAERAKHVRDVDALARLVGPSDRAGAALTTKERSTLARIAKHPDISRLAARSIQLTIEPGQS